MAPKFLPRRSGGLSLPLLIWRRTRIKCESCTGNQPIQVLSSQLRRQLAWPLEIKEKQGGAGAHLRATWSRAVPIPSQRRRWVSMLPNLGNRAFSAELCSPQIRRSHLWAHATRALGSNHRTLQILNSHIAGICLRPPSWWRMGRPSSLRVPVA